MISLVPQRILSKWLGSTTAISPLLALAILTHTLILSTNKALAESKKEPLKEAPMSSTIESTLIYRASILTPRVRSVYNKKEHGDFADQPYAVFRFSHYTGHVPDVVIEPAIRTVRNNPAKWDDPVIHQAYLETNIGKKWDFTAGKKVEYRGSGFLVNPSDLLNEQKDLFDPLYQQEGIFFSRLAWRHRDTKIGLGFIPVRGQPSKSGKFWITGESELYETEILVQMTMQESEKFTSGLSVQRFFGDHLELHIDSRYQSRQRKISEFEWLKYSESIGDNPNSQEDDRQTLYGILGSRLVISPRSSIIFEYLGNQSGLGPMDFSRRFTEFAEEKIETEKTREPPTQYIGRKYGFIAYQNDELLPGTHFSISLLANAEDKSTFTSITAKKSVSKTISAEITPMIFRGGERTEFGEMPFSSVIYLTLRGKF
jgi:hypothetical protein